MVPQTSAKNCKYSNFTMIAEVNQNIINVQIIAPIQQLWDLHVKNMKLLKDKRLSIISSAMFHSVKTFLLDACSFTFYILFFAP